MTETMATGGIETEGRTGRGDFELGQDGFHHYQDKTTTKTNIDEAKTKGPNQLHQEGIKTNIDVAKNKALSSTKPGPGRPARGGEGDEERAGEILPDVIIAAWY